MPEDDENLVIPRRELCREVARTRAFSNRHAVHEDGARAHGAQPETRAGRRPRQPEARREGHGRGLSAACRRGKTDPPCSGEGVGKASPRGQDDAREGEERRGEREKAMRSSPPADR